jgi:A/G-specific adenine glycosylase
VPGFAERVVAWQRQHGRHGLPWQGTRDPYRVWLSEVMLQQTQVATVVPYYERFLARYPRVEALADAPVEEVMASWAGLGYYSRARHLHACARAVVTLHGGRFPDSAEALARLPGIGPSTAAAIAAFAYGERAAILDGNVKRVFARHFGVAGWPGQPAVERELWQQARAALPERDVEVYTQGLMDLGATLCTRSRPACVACPVATTCVARAEGRQTELPGARPRRDRPVRAASFVVLVHRGQVLLERRPPAGIWGGLLALPQFDPDLDAAAVATALQARCGLRAVGLQRLAERQHDFTHYRLVLQLWRGRAVAGGLAESSSVQWWPFSTLQEAALPAPHRKLLSDLGPGAAAPGPSTS